MSVRQFPGSSLMAERCRAFDWGSTPIGPIDAWSQSLWNTVCTMLESRHPMFLWWGPDLIQIYNDGYRPSFGQNGRDVAALGARGKQHWAEIWPIIGPQIEGVLQRGEATWHEDHLVPIERNGKVEDVYWTYGYSPVRDDDGSIAGVLVVVTETTERVRTEAERERLLHELETERARLAYVFQRTPSFLAVLRGKQYVFELVNKAYYQLVGHRDLIGKPALEALPEITDQGFIEILDNVVATGVPFIGSEVPVTLQRAPDAEPEQRYVDLAYLPFIEADGSISGVIAHGSDVTDHVLTRHEAERAREMAESANKSKSDFLAVMSHELRTPLNAIGGYVELLEMGIHGDVSASQAKALARIRQSQQHLLGLISSVLDFAKVESGAIRYDIEDVPVNEVISASEVLTAPQVRARNLKLEWTPTEPRLWVRADRDKLQQILLNLVANAIKFTPAGGTVTIDARETRARVCIEVSDTGPGISSDQLDRVFEPFVQADASFTRTHEGVGLGLSISRDLAIGMGGNITVRSEIGEGSCFMLELPRANPVATPKEA